jgi:plastocyanin
MTRPRSAGRLERAARPVRRSGHRLGLALLTTALSAAALLAAAPPRTEPGVSVRGSVRVMERTLFAGLREREDRSGAIVYLTGFAQPAREKVVTLAQRDERFEPKLLPIVAGQSVAFPNFDRIYHNVFSVSPIKNFDLGQYRSTDPPRSVVFESPGLVPIFCNIHPHMISYVVVLENPAFSLTAADGSFEITGAPPGPVTVNAWIPGATRVSQPLTLADGVESAVALELVASEKVAPHKRKDGTPYPKKGPKYKR